MKKILLNSGRTFAALCTYRSDVLNFHYSPGTICWWLHFQACLKGTSSNSKQKYFWFQAFGFNNIFNFNVLYKIFSLQVHLSTLYLLNWLNVLVSESSWLACHGMLLVLRSYEFMRRLNIHNSGSGISKFAGSEEAHIYSRFSLCICCRSSLAIVY